MPVVPGKTHGALSIYARAVEETTSGRMSIEVSRRAKTRFGLRWQLLLFFGAVFSIVFLGAFAWFRSFTVGEAIERLREDLDGTMNGTVVGIDAAELMSLYREGERAPDGYTSEDPRYARLVDWLAEVHRLEPRALPYVFVRGDARDTRRVGPRASSPEFVYVADVSVRLDRSRAARFLEPDHGSPQALAAYERGHRVRRSPEVYSDRFGRWMTSYAPIRDRSGRVVAVLGIDFEADYVDQVAHAIDARFAQAFIVTFAVLFLLAFAAARLFTRPLELLTAATRDISRGRYGTTLDVGARQDELGALASSFNDMSTRLESAFRELEEANVELENRVALRTAELAKEKEKSERLLRNVLPDAIAAQLKDDSSAIAEGFDSVTVLFADIVGFTELSARTSPIELVGVLNRIFSAFDALADRHGLEKIKTIGDAYMVVGGLPSELPNHEAAVASMALDMQAFMSELRAEHPNLAIRVGMHTGPVVAGVIGTRKFSYDLWGDTVNVASRMESHGAPGRIQLTEPVARAIRGRFDLEERGAIQVKGRGEMKTYWLLGVANVSESVQRGLAG